MITIVDYGLGNIAAFANVYNRANIQVSIARTADDLKGASKQMVESMSEKQLEDFAHTKQKGKPKHSSKS